MGLNGSFCFVGNFSGAEYYAELMEAREEMFNEIFWNESSGTWRDFDITASKHLENFYLSSVAPLVWGCGSRNVSKELSTLRYLEVSCLLVQPQTSCDKGHKFFIYVFATIECRISRLPWGNTHIKDH